MPTCQKRNCGSANVIKISKPFAKFPYWRCNKCGFGFMEQADRLKILANIGINDNLKDIDDSTTIIKTWFEFIAMTDPEGTGLLFKKYIEEKDPDFYKRIISFTTIERDRRRPIETNEKGLNATWREEKEKTLFEFA